MTREVREGPCAGAQRCLSMSSLLKELRARRTIDERRGDMQAILKGDPRKAKRFQAEEAAPDAERSFAWVPDIPAYFRYICR